MRVLLRVNSHGIRTKQENVRSSRKNKGWIIQMRVFVFTLRHKESKIKMKSMFRKKACSK